MLLFVTCDVVSNWYRENDHKDEEYKFYYTIASQKNAYQFCLENTKILMVASDKHRMDYFKEIMLKHFKDQQGCPLMFLH